MFTNPLKTFLLDRLLLRLVSLSALDVMVWFELRVNRCWYRTWMSGMTILMIHAMALNAMEIHFSVFIALVLVY